MLVSSFITHSYTLWFSTTQGLLAALHLEFVTSINKQKKPVFKILVRILARIHARVLALYLGLLLCVYVTETAVEFCAITEALLETLPAFLFILFAC